MEVKGGGGGLVVTGGSARSGNSVVSYAAVMGGNATLLSTERSVARRSMTGCVGDEEFQ